MVTGVKISEQTVNNDVQDEDYFTYIRSNGDSPETFVNRRARLQDLLQLRWNQTTIITLADADYTLTEDESGWGAYFFNASSLSTTRTITLDPAYNWCGSTTFINGFTVESLDITFDGGTPITLAGGEACTALTAPGFLLIYKTGSYP